VSSQRNTKIFTAALGQVVDDSSEAVLVTKRPDIVAVESFSPLSESLHPASMDNDNRSVSR
ncbi:MAG: hypothetical protein ABW124_16015, partial [Candidatus Thiodiazotropha sp. 6PLUC9]